MNNIRKRSIWETPYTKLPWWYRWFMQPMTMALMAVGKMLRSLNKRLDEANQQKALGRR